MWALKFSVNTKTAEAVFVLLTSNMKHWIVTQDIMYITPSICFVNIDMIEQILSPVDRRGVEPPSLR